MSDDVLQAYEDLRNNGTASAIIVRHKDMPEILASAKTGNEHSRMALHAVSGVIPAIERGGHNCVVCNQPVTLNSVAAMFFVSKNIEPGADALWAAVCGDCDEADPDALAKKVMDKMGFKRMLHEAGHG